MARDLDALLFGHSCNRGRRAGGILAMPSLFRTEAVAKVLADVVMQPADNPWAPSVARYRGHCEVRTRGVRSSPAHAHSERGDDIDLEVARMGLLG